MRCSECGLDLRNLKKALANERENVTSLKQKLKRVREFVEALPPFENQDEIIGRLK